MSSLLHIAEELSKLPFLQELEFLKEEVNNLKPLPEETEQRILQKFRLDWNFHSNAIEGNKLTYGETVAFIMEGLTAKGKPFKDHLDIKGHNEAVNYLVALIKDKTYLLTEADIRNLHTLLLKEPYWTDAITPEGLNTKKEIKIGQYKSSPNHVKTPTGETHYYAAPEQTPIEMGALMEWYRESKSNDSVNPLVLATLYHHQFTAIHPFDDGNGRMARLIMNLILMQEDYPPIVIKQDDRQSYYQVLRQADAGEYIPITEYMSGLLKHSLNVYLKGAKGESIVEADDLDKEIKLFVKSKIHENKHQENYSKVARNAFLDDSFFTLITTIYEKIKLFEELFMYVSVNFLYTIKNDVHVGSYNDKTENNLTTLIEDFKQTDERVLQFSCWLSGYKFSTEVFTIQIPMGIRFDDFNYHVEELKTISNSYSSNVNSKIFSKFYHQGLNHDEIDFIVQKVLKEVKEIIESKTKWNEQKN